MDSCDDPCRTVLTFWVEPPPLRDLSAFTKEPTGFWAVIGLYKGDVKEPWSQLLGVVPLIFGDSRL